MMAAWIASVHLQLQVFADNEKEARELVRDAVAATNFRFNNLGPGHSVSDYLGAGPVRLDRPLWDRLSRPMFVVVPDLPGEDGSYDETPVVAGPFLTHETAEEWVQGNDRYVIVERQPKPSPPVPTAGA